jgi:hypothetical protein
MPSAFRASLGPARLGALGLIEVRLTAAALNRVDRREFFKSFDEGHAVQYFYEPFLHAFDPELRKELGVWYTPEEIVRYQVERVDAVLRFELSLADGLADPNVIVLDPCCGTGAYLRAVLRRIAATLHDKGGDALVANDLKKAAMACWFEILPAPFIIAHLQLGLELPKLGAVERPRDPPGSAGVYLTNASPAGNTQKKAEANCLQLRRRTRRHRQGEKESPFWLSSATRRTTPNEGDISPELTRELTTLREKLIPSGHYEFNRRSLYPLLPPGRKRIAEHGGRGVARSSRTTLDKRTVRSCAASS